MSGEVSTWLSATKNDTRSQPCAGSDVRQRVRKIVEERAGIGPAIKTIDDAADLYQAGLTSFASVTLMLALENEFEVEFPDAMLGRVVFQSIETITNAIQTLMQEPH